MHDIPALTYRASSIKHKPSSNRYYFDVGIGSVCLSGTDTGGAYCLLEVSIAPGISVPRHTHTREDEAYFVLAAPALEFSSTPAAPPKMECQVLSNEFDVLVVGAGPIDP